MVSLRVTGSRLRARSEVEVKVLGRVLGLGFGVGGGGGGGGWGLISFGLIEFHGWFRAEAARNGPKRHPQGSGPSLRT